ncbi:hypothetical protein Tsubulata_033069, partial [Turnera subulata]
MGKKRVLVPAEEVDFSTVKYEPQDFQAPHLTGWVLKLFVKILQIPLIRHFIMSNLQKRNGLYQVLRNSVIPEAPMYNPQFPPQEKEEGVVTVDEDGKPEERVEVALNYLPRYDPASRWNGTDLATPFRYWKIRDYAHAYRSNLVTPSMVAEHVISVIKEFSKKQPPMPLLLSFDEEDVRKQAAASTKRFEQGNPISILDGIFMAIKDDIDCYPHPTTGTLYSHLSVYLPFLDITTRNPHAVDRYTGGSSSGSTAIVASGICSAALGTDAGGSVRIPSSLCGVLGLKTTHGSTNMEGVCGEHNAVLVVGPIATSVEDVILLYASILGSSATDRISLNPSPPCLPNLASLESINALGSLRLGKYTEWFNDVLSTDVSDKCEDILNLLPKTHGCRMEEIVIPELPEMRTAHLVAMAESLCSLLPYVEEGKHVSLDIQTNIAFFQAFTASDFVASQCLRRRFMHYHLKIFRNVDVIVTPTTGMTAPIIPPSALQCGESNLRVTAYLMRFVLAANLLGFPAITVP